MPSGILQNANVIFYHPLDDYDEFVESLTWVSSEIEFVPGLLNNCVRGITQIGNKRISYNLGSQYTSLGDASGITTAVWASGFLNNDNIVRIFEVGLGFSAPILRQSIKLNKGSTPSDFTIHVKVDNTLRLTTWTPPPANDSDWHLFILDAHYETSGWRHRISLDGSPWLDLGVDTNTKVFNGADTEPVISFLHNASTGVHLALEEVVMWGDADLFTDEELSNIYELYNTHNTTMDEYESTYGIPINSGIDCFVEGHMRTSGDIGLSIAGQFETKSMDLFIESSIQISGNIDLHISGSLSVASGSTDLYMLMPEFINENIDLYIQGNKSIDKSVTLFIEAPLPEFLYDDNVIFYHPLDNLTEYTKDLDWTPLGDKLSFVPGLLGSGIQLNPGEVAETLFYPASTYNSVENASGITMCVWVSGFMASDTVQRFIELGIGPDDLPGQKSIAAIFKSAVTNGFNSAGRFEGIFGFQEWTPIPTNDTDWHFFVVDLRYEGNGWRHRLSFDGADWLDLGVNAHGDNVTTADSKPLISINDSVTVTVTVDEAVFWGYNDLFTAQELSNLYELYNTHNATMNQYASTYGILVSGEVNCFIEGNASVSGNMPLYIPGQKETNSIDLFLSVPEPASGEVGLWTLGHTEITNATDHYTEGHESSSGNLDMYLSGFATRAGVSDLYIPGPLPTASSITLYIAGPIPFSGSVDHFIEGHIPASGEFTLFMQGDWAANIFVAVVANNPSNTLDLFIHGAPLGISDLSFIHGSASLYIEDDGINDPASVTWPSFVGVADPLTIPHSGTWPSFVRCGNTDNDDIKLYTYGHASGSSIHGSLVTDSFATFIEGLASFVGDEGLLFDGFSVIDTNLASFTKVHSGINNTFSLYTSGSPIMIVPSAVLNLFTFGISGTISGLPDLYIYGNDAIINSSDFYTFGIQGLESGTLQLYIEVPNSGSLTKERDLYTHGY